MSKQKITNGEWIVEYEDVVTKDNVEGNVICSAPDKCCSESRKNWEANAKMISAAPDMFYALQNILDELEDCFLPTSINYYLNIAKTALKKAGSK